MPNTIYSELLNELTVGMIILREFNAHLQWHHTVPMNDYLLELCTGIDSLFTELEA